MVSGYGLHQCHVRLGLMVKVRGSVDGMPSVLPFAAQATQVLLKPRAVFPEVMQPAQRGGGRFQTDAAHKVCGERRDIP